MDEPILVLTNSRKRVVFCAFRHGDTYDYKADGVGGCNHSYETIIQRAVEQLMYHSSARPSGEPQAVSDYLLLASKE